MNELSVKEPPKQREFGRLSITGVVTSKRYLRQLVEGQYVEGWDDPRMPTIRGLRRRGFTPESIRDFIDEIGLIRNQSTVDIEMLEHALRQDLKSKVNSVMVVLNPLKVVITNYPEDGTEYVTIENNSENKELGERNVPFSRVIYIEKDDFMEQSAKGFHRLTLDTEVRLKGAYYIRCNNVIKDDLTGGIIELHCTYDPRTKSGTGFNERKVKSTIHWVSAEHGTKVDIHLYDKLILDPDLAKDETQAWDTRINPESIVIVKDCIAESSLATAQPEDKFQLIRHGYFCADSHSKSTNKLIFNRIVSLKDTWKKQSLN